MCIIASVPAGALLTEDMLSEMWTRNPDGGGISYFKDNEIVTEKSMDRKKFIAKVLDIQSEYGDRDILVHMRIATHGKICLENNHPFQVNKTTVMAHNGIMPDAFIPPAKSELSDTRFFIEYFMKYIPVQKLDDPYFTDMVDDMIGRGYPNKLVFMTSAKTKYDTYIIGDYHGTYDSGIWFSNESYKARKWVGYDATKNRTKTIDATTGTFCEPEDPMDTQVIDESDVRDWMTWNPELVHEMSEIGFTDYDEMKAALSVEMTWGGLICADCGEKVEGFYGRYCEADCPSISHVIDWMYDNMANPDQIVDDLLYSGQLYKGAIVTEQPKLPFESKKKSSKTKKSTNKKSSKKKTTKGKK